MIRYLPDTRLPPRDTFQVIKLLRIAPRNIKSNLRWINKCSRSDSQLVVLLHHPPSSHPILAGPLLGSDYCWRDKRMAINRVYFQNCCGTKMETLWSLFPPYRPMWGHGGGGGAAEVELYAGRRIIYVAGSFLGMGTKYVHGYLRSSVQRKVWLLWIKVLFPLYVTVLKAIGCVLILSYAQEQGTHNTVAGRQCLVSCSAVIPRI